MKNRRKYFSLLVLALFACDPISHEDTTCDESYQGQIELGAAGRKDDACIKVTRKGDCLLALNGKKNFGSSTPSKAIFLFGDSDTLKGWYAFNSESQTLLFSAELQNGLSVRFKGYLR